MAHHQMVVDEQGNLVAVGRCILMPTMKRPFALWPFIPTSGQRVRNADGDDPGVGGASGGVKRVTCSAREDAVEFFAKLGLSIKGRSPRQPPRRFAIFYDKTCRHSG